MKDGALDEVDETTRQPYVVPRRRLAIAAWLTVLAIPVLVIDNIPRTDARADQAHVAVQRDPSTAPSTAVVVTLAPTPPSTEPEVAAAQAPAPTTTARPTTTTVRPTTTTTTTVRPTTTTTTTTAPPAVAAGNTETGAASWYDYRAGECAHPSAPMGTVVTVTNLANGATTSCTVTDRGPFDGGRIIDLDRGTFAQIASTSQGVIQVRISW